MATSPVTFIKEVQTELKRVVWPTRDETIKLTAIVIIISAAIALYIGGLDIVFVKLTELIIKK